MRTLGLLLVILVLIVLGASLSVAIKTVLMVKLAIFGGFVLVATVMIVGYWLSGAWRKP